MTYITIPNGDTDPTTYQTDTPEQIEAAKAALREAGIDRARVYASPYSSPEESEGAGGGSEDYPNGQFLTA